MYFNGLVDYGSKLYLRHISCYSGCRCMMSLLCASVSWKATIAGQTLLEVVGATFTGMTQHGWTAGQVLVLLDGEMRWVI